MSREDYQHIVYAFSDLIAEHRPLIGDCSILPYPKKTILYAIAWLTDECQFQREAATNQAVSEEFDRLIEAYNYLLTVLARDWHEVDSEDKDSIAELAKHDSFPVWALPLQLKYINDEKASEEAFDAVFQVMKDRVNPSDPTFGSRNKPVTKARADAIAARLRKHFSKSSEAPSAPGVPGTP